MKSKIILSALVFAFIGAMGVFAKNDTRTCKVAGNCGMCEKRIETSAKGLEGVSVAEWDKKTKVLTVTFDAEKVTLLKIEEAVAAVGYDTENVKAKQEVYNKLPGCCKYERIKIKK